MADDILARVDAALEGVTPGPWEIYQDEPDLFDGYQIWHDDGKPGTAFICSGIRQGYDEGRADAEFIAAARTLVPELLSEVERLRTALCDVAIDQYLREKRGDDAGTDDYCRMRSIADGWQQRAYRAEAEVERLRGALNRIIAECRTDPEYQMLVEDCADKIEAVLRGDQ